MTPPAAARVHLLPARAASYVVALRRGPSRLVHVMRWNTQTDEIEHGSWFRGRLHEYRCDVSFDGEWMAYLAMGDRAVTWNGICRPPWLKTVADVDNVGTYNGGGLWIEPKVLSANFEPDSLKWHESRRPPFRVERGIATLGSDEGVLYPRLQRDGWTNVREPAFNGWRIHPREECPEWHLKPSEAHPTLVLWQRGYLLDHGTLYEFDLPDRPGLVDERVTWATYDSQGQLVLSRAGVLERYTLEDLQSGRPSFTYDTNPLRPPERTPREPEPSVALTVIQATATDVEAAALALRLHSDEERAALLLAGRPAQHAFRESLRREGNPYNEPFASDPYYLRYHVLLHIEASSPAKGVWALLDAALARRVPTLAIGAELTRGTEAACVFAARRWLERNTGVEAIFVAGDAEQAQALRVALEASE